MLARRGCDTPRECELRPGVRRAAVFALATLLACAGRPAPQVPSPAAPPPKAEPSAPVRPSEPPLDAAAARQQAEALIAKAKLPRYGAADGRERALALGLDELLAGRLIEAMTRDCLAAKEDDAPACAMFGPLPKWHDETLETLIAYLAEVVDTSAILPSTRLLVRLHAHGSVDAVLALEKVLERRMTSRLGPCSAPTEAEIAASSASLGNFAVTTDEGSSRTPTAAELSDLAYFTAAVSSSKIAVASVAEDAQAARLAKDAPELATRAALRASMKSALAAGDLEEHVKLARRYLSTLGYPGKIRTAEENDQRWGGHGYSYVMRDLALSDEILGDFEESDALYRRADPGGGMDGTSVASVRAGQFAGAIRASEQTRGCRPVVVERLFSVARGHDNAYGPKRLAAAGFDVVRLYRGALLTRGHGPESWVARTRAIPGYAAEGGKTALPDLVKLARVGSPDDRVAAIDAIGKLLEDHGNDPCVGLSLFGSYSSGGEREVPSLQTECSTRVAPSESDKHVKALAAFVRDTHPEIRQATAVALGRTGMPSARGPLQALAKDVYANDGEVCRSVNGEKATCVPDRPVRLAAEDALTQIREAEERRVKERAAKKP